MLNKNTYLICRRDKKNWNINEFKNEDFKNEFVCKIHKISKIILIQ